jgi:SsrA-binding protein
MRNLAYNRRAVYDFELLDKYEGGVKLLGTEVKSVRAGNVSLKGAFVTIKGEEVWLTNATIPPWQPANAPVDYDPTRPRKVLLSREEIKRLIGLKESKGLTIVPIRVYNKGSRVKLELALARGKRQYQKKERKREQDIKRDIDRELRGKE